MTTSAEALAYQRGYHAGRRRKAKDINIERRRAQREAFRQRVFVTVLPVCMTLRDWSVNGVPATSGDQKIELAEWFANRSATRFFG